MYSYYTHPLLPSSNFSGTPQLVSIPASWLGGSGGSPNSTNMYTWSPCHREATHTPKVTQ